MLAVKTAEPRQRLKIYLILLSAKIEKDKKVSEPGRVIAVAVGVTNEDVGHRVISPNRPDC